jgi:hypothetical protein
MELIHSLGVVITRFERLCRRFSIYRDPHSRRIYNVRIRIGQSVKCLAAGWKTGIRFLTREFSPRYDVQTDSGVHPASIR